jgi:hypothetical protein
MACASETTFFFSGVVDGQGWGFIVSVYNHPVFGVLEYLLGPFVSILGCL